MIKVRDLSYTIGQIKVLEDLNFTLQAGEYYALAGRNGAGKSTLIKILLDLIRNIDQGEIEVCGRRSQDARARQQLSYLPEKFDLPASVTGWQYLRLISGVFKRRLDRKVVRQLCDRLDLDHARLDDNASTYSKGMKQKLGLISCFMLDNPLVILDEPLSGLDPNARYHFKQLLKQERAKGRTVFYSTHMLADAEEICDRFGILHQGHIVFDGTPAQCIARYQASTLEQAYMRCVGETGAVHDSV